MQFQHELQYNYCSIEIDKMLIKSKNIALETCEEWKMDNFISSNITTLENIEKNNKMVNKVRNGKPVWSEYQNLTDTERKIIDFMSIDVILSKH